MCSLLLKLAFPSLQTAHISWQTFHLAKRCMPKEEFPERVVYAHAVLLEVMIEFSVKLLSFGIQISQYHALLPLFGNNLNHLVQRHLIQRKHIRDPKGDQRVLVLGAFHYYEDV